MKFNFGVLKDAVYHFLVVTVPIEVTQLAAVHGHLGRDVVISVTGGAVVSAWHTCFPGGLKDVKALLGKVFSFKKKNA